MIKLIIVGVIVTVVGLFALSKVDKVTGNDDNSTSDVLEEDNSSEENKNPDNTFDIEIDGEVNHPGVYAMEQTQTLGDLIVKAGGVTTNADTLSYLPEFVIGSMDYFYIAPKAAEYCEPKEGEKININSTSFSSTELASKLGVSKAIAEAIIDYRKTNGSFKVLEELKNVKGIGDKTYEKIRGLIRLK